MKRSLYALLLAICCAAPDSAEAANRTLLMIGQVDQALELSYELDASQNGTDTRKDGFEELYKIRSTYGVYHPRLLNGSVSLGFRMNQNSFTTNAGPGSSMKSFKLDYRIDGTFLDHSPYPVTFFAASQTATNHPQFAPSYDITSDSLGFGFWLHNRFLPLQLNYSRFSSEVGRSGYNSVFNIDSLALTARHNAGNFSRTSFSLNHFAAGTETTYSLGKTATSRSISTFSLANDLNWSKKGNGRALTSAIQFRQDTEGGESNKALAIAETLRWDFGKALWWRGSGRATEESHLDKRQTEASMELNHRLFKSLSTHLDARQTLTSYSFGTEKSTEYNARIRYDKVLPAAQGFLQLGAATGRTTLDRKFDATKMAISKQPLQVDFGMLVDLQAGAVESTIVVESADITKRATPYVLGVDYIVQEGAPGRLQIFILPSGEIPDGSQVLLSYDIIFDGSLKYNIATKSMDANLSLLDNRYRLFADIMFISQDPLSGMTTTTLMTDSRKFRSGVEFKKDALVVRGEYENLAETWQNTNATTLSLLYSMGGAGASLRFYLKDRISWGNISADADIDGGGKSSFLDNSAFAGITYMRNIGMLGQTRVTLDYFNNRGRIDRDNFSLLGSLILRLGKFTLDITPELRWESAHGDSRLHEQLRVKLTRFF